MNFSVKDFLSKCRSLQKWPNPQQAVDLVTFTVETLNGKLHFLHSVITTKLLNNEWYNQNLIWGTPTIEIGQ